MNLTEQILHRKVPPTKGFSTKRTSAWAEVDSEGRLILPREVVQGFGLKPGTKMRSGEEEKHFRLHRSLTQLTKVYVEPTVSCNLDCITCFRNEWDKPLGRVQDATFASVLEGLQEMDLRPSVYFGGTILTLIHTPIIKFHILPRWWGTEVENFLQ